VAGPSPEQHDVVLSRRSFVGGGLAAVGSLALFGGCGPAPPSPVIWYDASRITGVSSGTAIGTWNDVSGKQQNLTQATSSKRPKFVVTNGIPGVVFDGVNDTMQSTGLQAVLRHPFTVFVVATTRGGTIKDECLVSGDWTTSTGPFKIRGQASGAWTAESGDPAKRLSGGTKSTLRKLVVAHFTADGTNSVLRQNGVVVARGTTATSTSQSVFVGADRGTYALLAGTLHEVRVYTGLAESGIPNIEKAML
jgi:hypothetical protein